MLNLYLISRNDIVGWDEYDSAIVAAQTADEARDWHPDGGHYTTASGSAGWATGPYASWVSRDEVEVAHIGTALEGQTAGVILASFNAG